MSLVSCASINLLMPGVQGDFGNHLVRRLVLALPSPSSTRTQASTATSTASISQSQAQSATQTGTLTPSLSQTQTPSTVSTSSCTPSQSQSASQASSGSSSVTLTLTQTPSQSGSLTLSSSISATSSQTTSSTLSTSPSAQRNSPSQTATVSLPIGSTRSASISPSSSVTERASISPTRSMTGSNALTASTTQVPSVTSSPEPFVLLVSLTAAGPPFPSGGVVVSDSLPVVPLLLWLNRCPSDNDLAAATVRCTASAGLFAAVGPSASRVGASLSATLAAPCPSSGSTPVLLAQNAWVGAYFSAQDLPADSATVACSVTSSVTGQVLASTTIPVAVIPTMWPLWEDAVSVSAVGFMRSARIGVAVNATAALISAAAATSAPGGTTLNSALASPAAVMLAAQSLWANSTLTPGPSALGFTLTLVGASRVVLRAAAGTFAFSLNATNASVGVAAGHVTAASSDGGWAVLDTPSAADLCGNDLVECGYATLSLVNQAAQSHRGASLSCPPFCPGAIGAGVVPLALSDGSFTLGTDPTSPLGSLPVAQSLSSTTSEGLYYTVKCAQTGLWTDPSSGACANASDPASYNCALGSGVSCGPCPTGALCPGGSRVWARAGYWVPSEGSTTVSPCSPPNAASRCTGWSATLGTSQCGPAYLQGSFRCSACASGYFIDESGTCVACPAYETAWQVSRAILLHPFASVPPHPHPPPLLQRYDTLIFLCIAIVCIAACVYAVLVVVVCVAGGTITGGVYRMSNLMTWALMCAQVSMGAVQELAVVAYRSFPAGRL